MRRLSARLSHVTRRTVAGSVSGVCCSLWVFAAGHAHAQTRELPRELYCRDHPALAFDPVRNKAQSGRYRNRSYGYSVTIPAGLTAFTPSDGPERGFMLPLAAAPGVATPGVATPGAYLSVDAAYDVFYDITAAGVHRRDLNAIRLHDAVSDDASLPWALAQVPGGRYRMRVQCHGATAPTIHEEIIVVRNREIYRLDLQSTPERYARDVRTLEKIAKSWRWEPIP
jgi:hypothetical protein